MHRRNPTRRFAPRQGIVFRLVLAALGIGLLLVSPLAAAADDEGARFAFRATELGRVAPPSVVDLLHRATPSTTRLSHHVNGHLRDQFADLAGHQPAPVPGMDRVDWAMHHALTETVVDRARRGTRRGLEDFLRANTPVGPFIERLDRMNPLNRLGEIDPLRRMAQAQGDPALTRRERKFDLGVGFNHLTPGLEMSRPVGKGSIRTMIDVLGWVELEYVRDGRSRARLHVAYDIHYDEAVMGFRLGF